jgi:hypothetical protein
MPNRTKRTPKKAEIFLAALDEGCSIAGACERAVIARSTAYAWRRDDPDFAEAWDSAVETGTDALEDEAVKRAKAGSDTLLIFLLKARRPDKYKDRVSTEHAGSIAVRHEDALAALK